MSYRYKTCSYCHGNHAILDCEKLVEHGKEAEVILQDWDNSTQKQLHREASLIYTSYGQERTDEGEWIFKKVEVTEAINSYRARHYIIDTSYQYNDPKDCYWTKEEFRGLHADLPDTIPNQEYQDKIFPLRNDKKRYERIYRTYTDNEHAKAKRAKKSCSYCKGEGHTVRTCGIKNKDSDTYRDAYIISAYLTARAAARFGAWTGSMLKVNGVADGKLLHWQPQNRIPSQRITISATPSDQDEYTKALDKYNDPDEARYNRYRYREGAPTSVEDYTDWTYLSEFVQTMSYAIASKAYTTNVYVNYNERTTLSLGWENLDFANDKIVFPKSEDGSTAHYPTRCPDLQQRIFNAYMDGFRPIRVPQRKGDLSDAQYCIQISDVEDSWNPNLMNFTPSHYSATRTQLFADKKQRCEQAWTAVEKFVERNQDILNKAQDLIVL